PLLSLFPYTTLFRSRRLRPGFGGGALRRAAPRAPARQTDRTRWNLAVLLDGADDVGALGRREFELRRIEAGIAAQVVEAQHGRRSEEHTSELQSREN